MPDKIFTKEGNLIGNYDATELTNLAQKIAHRWHNATVDIDCLLRDSEDAWHYYLANRPSQAVLSKSRSSQADKFDLEDRKRQGFRLGHVPKAADSVVAFLYNTTFPLDDRFFGGVPKNELAAEFQEQFEKHLADNFGESNLNEEYRRLFLNLFLDGTAALHLPWKDRSRKKTVYKPTIFKFGGVEIPIPGTLKAIVEEVMEWEGTKVECLDFNDWRVDPRARKIEDSWFCRRWYSTTDKVQRDFPWIEEAFTYNDSFNPSDDNNKRENAGLPGLFRSINNEEEGETMAMLMVCYDDFQIGEDFLENHVVVTLNDQEVVYIGENEHNHGKPPYVVGSYIPIPGQIYGLSGAKHIIPAAELIDKANDEVLRIGNWAARPVFLKNLRDNAVRKQGVKEVRAGMTLPVESANAYQQLRVDVSNLNVLLSIIDKAEQHIEEVTGATPFVTGDAALEKGNPATAFEIDQRAQGGNSRFQSILTNINNAFIEPMMQQIGENEKQFRSEPVFVDGKQLEPDLIKQMEFKWIVTSTQATLTRNRILANLKALNFEIMPQLISQGIVELTEKRIKFDQAEALKQFFSIGGLRQLDKILQVEDGLPPLLQAQAAQEAAAGDSQVNGALANELPSVPPTPNEAAIVPAGGDLP